MAKLDNKIQRVNNSRELNVIDFGGFGDCGYRAIFGAFLFAHAAKELQKEQYQSLGLQEVLLSLGTLAASYLPADFNRLSSTAQLDELVLLYKQSNLLRNQLIIDGAESLRKTSVKNLHTSPRFNGFVVRDENTLKGKDADLKKTKAEKATTYISASEIASASEVLSVPIAIKDDLGLKKNEVYNKLAAQVPPLHIELSKAHYTARMNASVMKDIARKMNPPTAAALAHSIPFMVSATPSTKDTSLEQTHRKQTKSLDTEETYRNQREALKHIVSNLSTAQLSHLYETNHKDDYLRGNHGLDTKNKGNLVRLIATAAWKSQDIAHKVHDTLSKTNAKAAQAFQSQMKQQESESIAVFRGHGA